MKKNYLSRLMFSGVLLAGRPADFKNSLSEYPIGGKIVYGGSPLLEHTKIRGEFAGYENLFGEKLPVFINLKPTKGLPPEYPPHDFKNGAEGTLTVNLLVDKDGSVERFINSEIKATPGMTVSAAVALSEWQFPPIKLNGKNVRFIAVVPVTFKLREKGAAQTPNQALEPTPLPSTPSAGAEAAPGKSVAHL